MDLFDTHVHLLHPEEFTYEGWEGTSILQKPRKLEDYRRVAGSGPASVRVQSILFVEADVPAAQRAKEADFFGRIADHDRGNPALMAIIAGALPESAEFPEQLGEIVKDARVRGLRRVLSAQPSEMLQSELFAENLRRLPAVNLSFDLCVRPHQLAAVTVLVDRCPQTQFVLDHCGAPDIAGGDLEGWRAAVKTLAERSNVACKFSGLVSLATPGRPLTPQVRPVFEHCLDVFHPERMVWGSDWPVSSDLSAWLRTTAELLGELRDFEQAGIGTENAHRVYGMN